MTEQGPSTNDVVMQLCLPGCQSVQKPVTITMNLKDQSPRKKEGEWYWLLGVWDFSGRAWVPLCDNSKSMLNLNNNHMDVLETMVDADIMNKYIDPVSKCMLFAPINNYKGCPGRSTLVGITSGEAAAAAACAMFAIMLLIEVCICACM